jgi:hypothetical protein
MKSLWSHERSYHEKKDLTGTNPVRREGKEKKSRGQKAILQEKLKA